MKGVTFKEQNGMLNGGPARRFGTETDVGDLPVWRDRQQTISCWRPSWLERLSILMFGRVWLTVHSGSPHAPISLWGVRRRFGLSAVAPSLETEAKV